MIQPQLSSWPFCSLWGRSCCRNSSQRCYMHGPQRWDPHSRGGERGWRWIRGFFPLCSHCARTCLSTQTHRGSLAPSCWGFALTICFPISSPFSWNRNMIRICPRSADVVAHLLNESLHGWQSGQRAHRASGMGMWPKEWDACWGLLDNQKHLLAVLWEASLSPASIRARFASVCSSSVYKKLSFSPQEAKAPQDVLMIEPTSAKAKPPGQTSHFELNFCSWDEFCFSPFPWRVERKLLKAEGA